MKITIEQLLRILSLHYKKDQDPNSPPMSNLYIELSSKKPSKEGRTLVLEGDARTVVIDLLDEENIRGIEIT